MVSALVNREIDNILQLFTMLVVRYLITSFINALDKGAPANTTPGYLIYVPGTEIPHRHIDQMEKGEDDDDIWSMETLLNCCTCTRKKRMFFCFHCKRLLQMRFRLFFLVYDNRVRCQRD